MSLFEYYKLQILENNYSNDLWQEYVVSSLSDLSCELELMNKRNDAFFSRLITKITGSRKQQPKGRYIWGGVGRGKTWLMDVFFEKLKLSCKLRMHYQIFLQKVQKSLIQQTGYHDPLKNIAREYARQWKIICLDEFCFTEIVDATILQNLFLELNKRGVVLVMTSNASPDDLFKSTINRERFSETISFLKNNMQVIELSGACDYRQKTNGTGKATFDEISTGIETSMQMYFDRFGDVVKNNCSLLINGRHMTAYRCYKNNVWFDFFDICDGPRSANDYITIADNYENVFVSNIPVLTENDDSRALRFIQLVDVIYDKKVKMLINSVAKPGEIYQGKRFSFEFRRTASRILEMSKNHQYFK